MFNLIFAEGVVRKQGGGLVFTPDSSDPRDVESLLKPFLGQNINLAFHFMIPDEGLDPSKRGYGSCLWGEEEECPVGHHLPQYRLRMLSVKSEGILKRDACDWTIHQFDGEERKIPLHLMDGHHCRLVVAPVLDVQKMRERVDSVDVGVLGKKAEELKEVLTDLQKLVGEKNDV